MRKLTPLGVVYAVAMPDALSAFGFLVVFPSSFSAVGPSAIARGTICLVLAVMYHSTRHAAWPGVYATLLFLTALTCLLGGFGILAGDPSFDLEGMLFGCGCTLLYGTGGAAVTWAALAGAKERRQGGGSARS